MRVDQRLRSSSRQSFVFVALLRLLAPKRPPSVMFQGSASVCVCGVQYLGYGTHSKKIRSAVPSLLSLPKIPSRPYHNEKHSLFYCVSETVNDPKKEGTKGRRTSEKSADDATASLISASNNTLPSPASCLPITNNPRTDASLGMPS